MPFAEGEIQGMNTAEPTLTPRQLELLKTIASLKASRCYSPTIGELAAEAGISRSTTFEHIGELRKKGLLWGCTGKARSLKPTCRALKLLEQLSEQSSNGCNEKPAGVPLAGRVAAGLPIEAVESKEFFSLSSYFTGSDEIFALEVTGDSMVDDDIRDGDYVICRRSRVAENGQLVIAIVDENDATLKRFYRQKDKALLKPANDDYDPIYSDNCRIEALVIGLVRKL
jgi:repressor LexA